MKVNLEAGNLILRLWFMLHRTHDMLKACEDQVFGGYKITTEQFTVLATIKYLGEPAKVTDIARWLTRSTNSVSMIADRMAKAGLIRRVRDRSDRRVVNLFITNKGEEFFKPAILAGWQFAQEILSPMSYEDKQTLISLLLTVQYNTHKHLKPEENIEELRRHEAKLHANLMKRLIQYISPSTPEAKRQSGKKEKTR